MLIIMTGLSFEKENYLFLEVLDNRRQQSGEILKIFQVILNVTLIFSGMYIEDAKDTVFNQQGHN